MKAGFGLLVSERFHSSSQVLVGEVVQEGVQRVG